MKTASLTTVLGFVRRIAIENAWALTDRDLLERFTERRDESAFAELVRRHGPMVLAACRRVLRHEQDAEDVFQGAFLVLARRAGTIRQSETVGGWLYQVAYRLALRARTIEARRREQALPQQEPIAAGLDERISLDEELARLPERYRTVVILCYLEGRTQHEAAHILATTTEAVNSRLKRARDLLRVRYARHGLGLAALPAAASALHALPADAIAHTTQVALEFAINPSTACGASTLAVTLAKGASSMIGSTLRLIAVALGIAACLTAGVFFASASRPDEPAPPRNEARLQAKQELKLSPGDKEKPLRACIILWMSGGPSQLDTFDPKEGDVSLFPAIETNVKGLKFSKNLPLLAKQAHHLAVLRGMKTKEGDHNRGSHLMHTGYGIDDKVKHPFLGSVLAKELEAKPNLPRYVSIMLTASAKQAVGFLDNKYAPLVVGNLGFVQNPGKLELPGPKAFDVIAPDDADAMRKALAGAFNLDDEKPAVREAYGSNSFGQGCLLARRLVQAGVPVVEVTLGGWDTHGGAKDATPRLCGKLDAAFSSLLKDLEQSKRLEHTVIVWMGEFGRTPRINVNGGRDHWPSGFTTVLAGRGIRGGQAIGKTSANGFEIEERPLSAAELHATIYQALGIDPTKEYAVLNAGNVPLVEKGTKAVKEALR